MTFDRGPLTPEHSLNRVRTPARGFQPAGSLLSRAALIRRLRDQVTFSGGDEALLSALEHDWLPNRQPAAVAAIAERGDALGDLLLILKRGERTARPEWSDGHWQFWRRIAHIQFGGGLAEGRIGQATVGRAQERIAAAYQLHVAEFPAAITLVGAARHLTIRDGSAVVFDCGNTAVKRARAVYREGRLVEMSLLPSLPAGMLPGPGATPADAVALAGWIARIVAGTRQPRDHAMVAVALASYVVAGVPCSDGAYGTLRLLADDVAAGLAARIRRSTGAATDVRLLHDGSAAAAVFAATPHTAVIMLGTSLGLGVPPPEDRLCPMAAEFRQVGGSGRGVHGLDSRGIDSASSIS